MNEADELLDRTVRHQVGLLRYSNGLVRTTLAFLATVEADILAQVAMIEPGSHTQRRLNQQLSTIRAIVRQGYDQLEGRLTADLEDLAAYEARFSRAQMQSSLSMTFNGPTRETVVAAVKARPFQGRFLREWMRGLDEDAGRRVRDAIRIGFVEGENTESLIRRIRGTRAARYQNGILGINRRSAERIVRTAINHTASVAREETYRSNPLVDEVQWVSVLDSRTSIICAGRDGKRWPVGEGPRPPAHPNCRSQITAIISGMEPPERVGYAEWFDRQPTEVQNEILGVTRARAYRSGKITLDRFSTRSGSVLSLEELAARDGISL